MTASRKKQKVADPVPAAFAERLAELRRRAAEREPGWLALLAKVKKAAEHSDESLHAEGRREAERRYGSASAAHFWPEPPSVALLIEQSVRTEAEVAFAAELDAICVDVGDAKAAQLARLQQAKAAADIDAVRELGRGLGALHAVVGAARALDQPVRDRIQVASRRIEAYRASRTVRQLDARARLVDVPPTHAGYRQVLDFYRLTDAGSLSFGRTLQGPQFFTDVRRNVAILHATRGPLASGGSEEGGEEGGDADRVCRPCGGGGGGEQGGGEQGGGEQGGGEQGGGERGGGELGGGGVAAAAEGQARALLTEDESDAGASSGPTLSGSASSETLFCEYAISGMGAPGLRWCGEGQPLSGPFLPIECADGLGESYLRDHDAEFKLVSELCARHLGVTAPGQVNRSYRGRLTLWSKKPLCASCSGVVYRQLVAALPGAQLEVRVDEEPDQSPRDQS